MFLTQDQITTYCNGEVETMKKTGSFKADTKTLLDVLLNIVKGARPDSPPEAAAIWRCLIKECICSRHRLFTKQKLANTIDVSTQTLNAWVHLAGGKQVDYKLMHWFMITLKSCGKSNDTYLPCVLNLPEGRGNHIVDFYHEGYGVTKNESTPPMKFAHVEGSLPVGSFPKLIQNHTECVEHGMCCTKKKNRCHVVPDGETFRLEYILENKWRSDKNIFDEMDEKKHIHISDMFIIKSCKNSGVTEKEIAHYTKIKLMMRPTQDPILKHVMLQLAELKKLKEPKLEAFSSQFTALGIEG